MIQVEESTRALAEIANYLPEEDMILMDYSCSGASLGFGTRFALFPGYIYILYSRRREELPCCLVGATTRPRS
jgi:hypothetical protein